MTLEQAHALLKQVADSAMLNAKDRELINEALSVVAAGIPKV